MRQMQLKMFPVRTAITVMAAAMTLMPAFGVSADEEDSWLWIDEFPNLIQNGGFENLDENGWAVGWNHGNWGDNRGEVSVDKEAPGGRQALRMHHTPWRYVRQRVTVEPGARHIISFFARGELVKIGDGGRGPGVHVAGGEGSYSLSYGRRLAGSFEWRRVVLAEDATFGDATAVEVTLENHRGGGTAWFDDVSMVKQTPQWEERRIQERLARTLRRDLESAKALARGAEDGQAIGELEAMEKDLRVQEIRTEQHDERSEPPYFPKQAELLAVMARLNARRLPDADTLVAWQVHPFQPLSYFDLVPAAGSSDRATAVMGRGEVEQIAINLCSLADVPSHFSLTVKQEHNDGPRLFLREAKYVKVGNGENLLADPLPRLGPEGVGGEVVLPPDLFKQIWVMIDSNNVPAGSYTAALDFGGARESLPLDIEILPVDFPDEVPVITWGYSYQHWALIKDRWDQALQDLSAHHINAYYWPARYLPYPTFDAEGNMQALDWSQFDQGLATHDNVRWLLLWMEVEHGLPWGRLRDENVDKDSEQEELERRFKLWFPAVLDGLQKRGFGHDRVAWSLSDEPCNWSRANAVERVGSLIKQIAPEALITANPYRVVKWAMLAHMDPVIDIWFPNLNMAEGHLLQFFQHERERTWSYQVLGQTSPAFTKYRRSFWGCWGKGITGQGFWNYAAPGFAVVYDGDPDELIPSVRWEAWREGVEDYTYLWMLREAVQAGQGAERARNEAQEFLSAAAKIAQTDSPEALSAAREHALRLLAVMQP